MTIPAPRKEWAHQIKLNVEAEFRRVVDALREVASRQQSPDRADTAEIMVLLEALCRETLAAKDDDYFIRIWQEPGNQVRQMLLQDFRYRSIQARRQERRAHLSLETAPLG